MAVWWAPSATPIDDVLLEAAVEAMCYSARAPLSEQSLELLGRISKSILASPIARTQPQYVALGYWLRPASLKRMCEEFRQELDRPGYRSVSRGVALHLPPTNVDTIFVYSWALSLLAGNCNIVRMPSEVSSGADWLVRLVAGAIQEAGEGQRQIFCQVPQSGPLNTAIASHCDLRMIWGGDEKVEAVNMTPIRPDGLSLGFPDRKSLSVVSVSSYSSASDEVRDALAAQFFNDVFWFDQMGCGSPRLLVWVGDPGDLSQDFYRRLQQELVRRQYIVEPGVIIGKFALANDLLAEGIGQHAISYSAGLHVVESNHAASALGRTHGGGFLIQSVVPDVTAIAPAVDRKVQTIGHFGLSDPELSELADAIAGRGGYRIVPIGQALQFDSTWDGVPLLAHMTRRVRVQREAHKPS